MTPPILVRSASLLDDLKSRWIVVKETWYETVREQVVTLALARVVDTIGCTASRERRRGMDSLQSPASSH